MATVNFYIRKSKAQGSDSGAVFLKYFDKGEQFTHTLDYEVDPSQWIIKEGRAMGNTINQEKLNLSLNGIANKILAIRLTLCEHDEYGKLILPAAEQVKSAFLGNTHGISKNSTIVDLLNKFISDTDTLRDLDDSTIKNYTSTINNLILFGKSKRYKISQLMLRHIKISTFFNIMTFFTDDKDDGGLEIINSTTLKYISCIKTALRHYEDDLDINIKFIKKLPKLPTGRDIFFATYEELEDLKKVRFTDRDMDIAVKLYINGCYAPARLEDMREMEDVHLANSLDHDKNLIHLLDFISGKTGVRTLIPLNNYCTNLIQEMCAPGDRLYQFPEGDISTSLRKAFKASGVFNTPVNKRIFRGFDTKPRYEKKAKWDVLTFHTTRHSFVTNMLSRGEAKEKIMVAMGWTSLNNLNTYTHLMPSEYYSSIIKHQNGVKDTPILQILKQG